MSRYIRTILFSLLVLSSARMVHAQSDDPFPYDFRIAPVEPANTKNNDYAPTLSTDNIKLWFCSYGRPEGYGQADIYRLPANDIQGEWSSPVNTGDSWNSRDNEGALAVAADGVTVVVAMDGPHGIGDTDLWLAELKGDSLLNLRNMGKGVNSRWWDSQPTMSPDGRTIYFASNRPGGFGGVDIWMTHLENGRWSKAVPLDSTINTRANERSPFINRDGTALIFASDRKGGYGGLDFWMCRAITNKLDWGEPFNLGSRINSSGDEMFFHAPKGYPYFFFASSRSGGKGGLDIYSGSPNIFGEGTTELNVRVIDTVTGLPAATYVTVVDIVENVVVAEFTTDEKGVGGYRVSQLPAGRDYRVTAYRKGEGSAFEDVLNPKANQVYDVQLEFGIRPDDNLVLRMGNGQILDFRPGMSQIVLFDLDEFNVPFFVTGYYRPNTPESLPKLLDQLQGPLSGATYIERFPRNSARHKEYIRYSEQIDSIFNGMAIRIVDEIAPNFLKLTPPDEILEVTITGYVDPQVFRGPYLENESITFNDPQGGSHTVKKGEMIENFELSGLRSVYARELIEKMLRRHSEEGDHAFLTLLNQGRVRYRVVAGGVSGGTTVYDRQRRIHVMLTRERP